MALDSPTQTEDYLPTTAQESAPRPPIPSAPVLYMAIELASKQWKIAFSDGEGAAGGGAPGVAARRRPR